MNTFTHTLSIDLETFSDVDLAKSGVYPYSESAEFRILLFAYAFNDEPVRIIDIASGESLPTDVLQALTDPAILKTAFNAQFERICLSRFLYGAAGSRFLDPSQWECTMVHAAMLGLPFSLDAVAKVLGTGEQKDKRGEDLIKYFSVPCKPTKSNGGRVRNMPSDAPDKWELFKAYCKQDVATERDIRNRLSMFPIPEREQEFYIIDQQINDRGVLIDLPMVEQAIKCDLLHSEILTHRAYELTSLENPNSVSQLKMWLEERGLSMDTLGKKEVAAQIKAMEKNCCDAELLEMLKLRLQMAKSSVKKYQAAERAVCADSRARGLFRFYGANHTGRWCLAEGSRVLVKDQRGRVFEKRIENVLLTDRVYDGDSWVTHEGVVFSGDKDVITWDGITATPEHMVFIDSSTKIPLGEAAEKQIPLWRGSDNEFMLPTHDYLDYKEQMESNMRTYDIINAGPKNRFMANGRIVSNSGRSVQLQNLPSGHLSTLDEARTLLKLGSFDALEYIYGNTPDVLSQLIRTMIIPKPGCEFVVADFSAIEARVLSWLAGEQWRLDSFRAGADIYCASASQMFGVPVVKNGVNGHLRQKGKVAELACIAEGQLVLTDHGLVPIQNVTKDMLLWDGAEWVYHNGVIYKGERETISYRGLTATPDHLVLDGSHFVPFGHFAAMCLGVDLPSILERSVIRPVYDIMNAGSRHQFIAGGLIVHNCGFGGAAGALIAMGALDMGLKEAELPDLINNWRSSNPRIVQFWWDVDKAATKTVKDGSVNRVGRITFERYAGELFITLPSGRKLAYASPRLEPNRFGRMGITYMGIGTNNKWQRLETYGAVCVENIVQGSARDLLAEAMLRVSKAGLDIILHCHDELCVEVPIGSVTVEQLCKLMSENPPWADGLPLSAAGFSCPYYQKD